MRIAIVKKIKAIAKRFISYRIENDTRIYQVKHTPFKVRVSLTGRAMNKYMKYPVEPKKIVFDNYMGRGYGCNGKYVTAELLRRRSDLDIVWMIKDIKLHQGEFPKGVRLVEYGTKQAMYEYYTAAVWVCNYHLIAYWNKGLQKRAGQKYIQMWHGSLGIKRIENDCDNLCKNASWFYLSKKNAQNTDYWISNSTFESEIYRRAFGAKNHILEYGHPRNDVFFDRNFQRITDKVKHYFGIGQNAKIVLYVPTFREKNGNPGGFDAEKLNLALLQKVLTELDGAPWQVVVRLHPRMQGGVESICNEVDDRVYLANDYPDIQELLCASDVVITDYSSCIFDFILTGKPGFIYAPDIREYNTERGFYYRLEETPFGIAETNQQLAEQIKNFDEHIYKRRVADFLAEKGCVETGKAAEKVCNLIETVLQEGNLNGN